MVMTRRLDPRIAPLGDEPVIVKHEVGGFSTPPLERSCTTIRSIPS
jgi:hypothetical protein